MRILAVAVVVLGILVPLKAEAACFKAFNETNVTIRGRVHDRGRWRDWVVMPPGFWDCFAPQVKRQKHDVELEYRLPDGTWKVLEHGRHGSIWFTRVIHFEAETETNSVRFTYWDEPPGCRDKPKGNGRANSCLKEPGWLKKIAIDWLIKVAKWGGNKLLDKDSKTQDTSQSMNQIHTPSQTARQPRLVFSGRTLQ